MDANTAGEHSADRPVVMVRADDVDVARANQQLKQAIACGATGIAMVFEGSHNAYSYGLPLRDDTMELLFDGIALDGLHLRLDNHPHGSHLNNQFAEFLQQNTIHPQKTKITFGIDPTASLATCGKLKMSIAALKASLLQSMSAFFASGLPGIVLEADGRPYHDAGGSRAQELGAMICIADEHLDMVEAGRQPIAHALPHIGFATALTGNFSASIIKLRALQQLWGRVQRLRGIKDPVIAPIHVETSRRMLLPDDLAGNNVRNTLAAMAAIVGGASSLSLLPASTPLGLPHGRARELTLVSQITLMQENPELGSNLQISELEIGELCQQAWAIYQDFKAAGGVMACLIDGSLAQQLSKTHEQRIERLGVSGRRFSDERSYLPALMTGQETADIYGDPPVKIEIEGIEHCAPLLPVFSTDRL